MIQHTSTTAHPTLLRLARSCGRMWADQVSDPKEATGFNELTSQDCEWIRSKAPRLVAAHGFTSALEDAARAAYYARLRTLARG